MSLEAFQSERELMVRDQLQARGIIDERVLETFRRMPRHLFVPASEQANAYADRPLAIGSGQTISQPYIVALMTQVLRLQGHERILEIGTGSGYQGAILAELALELYSVERVRELAEAALHRWKSLGYLNVHVRISEGGLGWPEEAPFEAIIVTAGAPRIPPPLIDQLAPGGRLVIPVGSQETQRLTLVERRGVRVEVTEIGDCVFVPLLGEYGWPAG